MAHATTWKASAHKTAFGQRALTALAIQVAASALTWVISWHRCGPTRSKNVATVASSRPTAAHTSRPVSWSTTTVR